MDLLIQWVTQIIIFLLIATLVDLIIPQNAMKKYIKLVVGLTLVLIFLKPIFHLFQFDIKSEINATSTQHLDELEGTLALENLIENQKRDIESTQHAYILEQMAVQLKEIANPSLIEEHQIEITEITFTFLLEEQYTFENLEEVIVYVQEARDGEGVIYAVDDIVIDTSEPSNSETATEEDVDDIVDFLTEKWQLDDKKLMIRWGGGSS
ncbi:stage III sporulation protein AF [Virgibacillus soli]|uniref:Stage III sporulation protein AF n=1 Tax=Paracerasibacillus soli TaxID=480284 RepID=A0ABU5CPX2_9BACI|nr:stage III sporulation protein AF [Virgibacillus soli]MDY0408403.1 stage III sporulation protein AF [Virgibacillus soli]